MVKVVMGICYHSPLGAVAELCLLPARALAEGLGSDPITDDS